MQTESDAQLLAEYAVERNEAAFAEIVARHTNLVYSAALRQVASPDAAAEIAQQVFIGLAQAAQSLSKQLAKDASLAGWLCRSARNLSLNHRRDEFRRHAREKLAMEDLHSSAPPEPDWERMRSVLDAAMSELDESDYDALVMRFFRNQDLRSVGRALGVSDDTAQKRVARALEKLRAHLSQRGIATTAAALSAVLSTKAIQAAPAGLAASIAAATSLTHSAAGTSTAIALTKSIAMTTLQKAFVTAAFAAAVGTGVYQAHRASVLEEQTTTLKLQHDALSKQLQEEREAASNKLALAQHQNAPAPGDLPEIAKLRAQVAKLRNELDKTKAAMPAADQDSTAAEMKSWLARVKQLKDKLAQLPGRAVPEFQYLTDQDWLDAVKDIKQLQTDHDYEQAMNALANSARREFGNAVQGALQAYAKANNGALASDFSQLQSFFTTAPDSAILQGYEFSQPGTIVSKSDSLIDQDGNYYSSKLQIGMDSFSSSISSEDALHQAIQAYLAANNGQNLTDPAQLLPYVTTPAEKTALQKIIQSSSGH